MEFDKRKAAAMAAMNSPELDNSPKGTLDLPIIPLLKAINSHPSFFTTSSCSGRISVLSQPTTSASLSGRKKKAKGGTWIFISHDPVHPSSLLPILYPSASDSQSPVTNEHSRLTMPEPLAQSLVFRFEPLIIAVECRNVAAAQSLVSLAISCGFRESGITSVSKRVIIAIRCSIRMEVPLGDTLKIMVAAEYVEYLVKVANEKMQANMKRTDLFLDALIKNGFSGNGIPVNGEVNDNGVEQFNEAEKIGTLGNSLGNVVAAQKRDLGSENKVIEMGKRSLAERAAPCYAEFQARREAERQSAAKEAFTTGDPKVVLAPLKLEIAPESSLPPRSPRQKRYFTEGDDTVDVDAGGDLLEAHSENVGQGVADAFGASSEGPHIDRSAVLPSVIYNQPPSIGVSTSRGYATSGIWPTSMAIHSPAPTRWAAIGG